MSGYDSICCFSGENIKTNRVCWELLSDCNLKCYFCHRNKEVDMKYDFKNMEMSINLLNRYNIKKVILSGGEPLMHPKLFEIVDTLKENEMQVDLCTNAYYYDESISRKIAYRFNEVSISIDSFDKYRHDSIRGVRGAFDRTITNVKKLIELGVNIHSTTLVTIDMIDDIPIIVSFLHKLGIKSMAFIGYIPFNTGENLLLEPKNQEKLKRIFFDLRTGNNSFEINTKQLIMNDAMKCHAGRKVFGMGPDGLRICSCLLLRDRSKLSISHKSVGCCPGSRKYTT